MNMNKILWAIIEEDSNITFANLCSGDSVYKSPSEPESSRSGVLTPAGRTPRQMKVQGPHVLTRPSCGWGGGQRSHCLLSVLQQSAATSKARGSAQLPATRGTWRQDVQSASELRNIRYQLQAEDEEGEELHHQTD